MDDQPIRVIPARPAATARRPERRRRTAPLLPFEITERTLPNGLRVIVVPTGLPEIVSVQIPVQTGSRNEVEPGKSGFAHFFEHMMFRGTPTNPPERYQAILTAAGARQNAYTTDDYTNYHVTFAREDLATLLEIEADRFFNLSYSEAAFKREARAVLGEYNKNSADPLNKLIEVQRDHAFVAHPYKHTTMGFLRDIEAMPDQFEYSRAFFERWYRPERTTLLLAGDISADEVLELARRYWGTWRRGRYRAEIPAEPPPQGPVYAHVAWESRTLPWITVAFHGPAFSETEPDFAAMDMLLDLSFGPTSDLYKRLVEDEQKVDQLFAYSPANADPYLATVAARVKVEGDAVYVRDELLRTFARSCSALVDPQRLADAKSNARYGLLRSLDDTEAVAATLARFVRFRRTTRTLLSLFERYDALTPETLVETARRYVTDAGLVVTTLSHQPLPDGMGRLPALASLAPAAAAAPLTTIRQPSALPRIDLKLQFAAGSARDPMGKEGLAELAAAMIADAGSRSRRIDEVRKALFPLAASFDARVDKEVTTFSGALHPDHAEAFLDLALPLLVDPGFREEDFARVKDRQKNALVQDLRASNEEELARERLQANLFAGTPYGHPALGTVAGIEAISLDDVKAFVADAYTRGELTVGLAGRVPEAFVERLERDLGDLPQGPKGAFPPPDSFQPRQPRGREVEVIEKETRSTAISFGHPITVTRSHPDFPALFVARCWLGEHRSSMSHLYERIREIRGMNYGDYAYIEAFPGAMFSLFPPGGVPRRHQLFEVWIRPVLPENAPMALRIAVHELQRLIDEGLTEEAFATTRRYLMKNVLLMTASQDLRLGYGLDSRWYGTPEFAPHMRERLRALTLEEVNAAIRQHLSTRDLSLVAVTRDAQTLRDWLVSGHCPEVRYEAEKPAELLEEDRRIQAMPLPVEAEAVRITPVEEVFAG
jgi:zinc protease